MWTLDVPPLSHSKWLKWLSLWHPCLSFFRSQESWMSHCDWLYLSVRVIPTSSWLITVSRKLGLLFTTQHALWDLQPDRLLLHYWQLQHRFHWHAKSFTQCTESMFIFTPVANSQISRIVTHQFCITKASLHDQTLPLVKSYQLVEGLLKHCQLSTDVWPSLKHLYLS